MPVTYFKYRWACNAISANFQFFHIFRMKLILFLNSRTLNLKDSYILMERSPFTEFVSICLTRLKSGVTIGGSISKLFKLKKTWTQSRNSSWTLWAHTQSTSSQAFQEASGILKKIEFFEKKLTCLVHKTGWLLPSTFLVD